MRVARELDNFNPEGLKGKTIMLQLRRYAKTPTVEEAAPLELLEYPVHVVGLVESSPEDRVYGSLDMVRFARDYATGRSQYTPEPSGAIDTSRISSRTANENIRVHFDNAAAAENAFVEMRQSLAHRFDMSWSGQKMLYLRDVEVVSQIALIGIGLLAVVAGAVSIFNTLIAAVAHKTNEIGILRALGVERSDIFLIFVSQAVLIGLCASIAGVLLAHLAVIPLNADVESRWQQLAEAMQSTGGLFVTELPTSAWLIAAVLLICLVAALIPAVRATQMTPMDALRA